MRQGVADAMQFIAAGLARALCLGKIEGFLLERPDPEVAPVVKVGVWMIGQDGKRRQTTRAFNRLELEEAKHPVILARMHLQLMLEMTGWGREESTSFVQNLDDAGRGP